MWFIGTPNVDNNDVQTDLVPYSRSYFLLSTYVVVVSTEKVDYESTGDRKLFPLRSSPTLLFSSATSLRTLHCISLSNGNADIHPRDVNAAVASSATKRTL